MSADATLRMKTKQSLDSDSLCFFSKVCHLLPPQPIQSYKSGGKKACLLFLAPTVWRAVRKWVMLMQVIPKIGAQSRRVLGFPQERIQEWAGSERKQVYLSSSVQQNDRSIEQGYPTGKVAFVDGWLTTFIPASNYMLIKGWITYKFSRKGSESSQNPIR